MAKPSAPIDSADMTLVVVQNDRNVAVTVYAQNELGEHKIGAVAPYGTTTLSLDNVVFGETDVQFFVQPAGELEESTGVLEIDRGERIGVVVPPR
ncbi:MAG TPA: hypothetical protein VK636_12465 [Gemmatimonadaceae bacterium]|nr:hypothetical protein [Gemmatimonadaceae bacterium]